MTNCIYPGPHADTTSREHYLPAALGSFKNYEPLVGRLCTACNKKLGDELDVQLTRAGQVGLMRWVLGIHGSDGLPPSPFRRGAGKAKTIIAYAKLNEFEFPIAIEGRPGTTDGTPMRQIVLQHEILGTQAFPIFDGTTKEDFLAWIKAEGWDRAKPILAFADPSEFKRIEDFACAVGGQPDPSWKPIQIPSQPIKLVAELRVTSRYFRAIAKIALHYLLKLCPELDGNEREFTSIKEYIWTGSGGRRVHESAEQIFANFLHGEHPSCWSHFLYAIREGGRVFGYVQLFVGPQAMFPPYRVDIGPDPARIRSAPKRFAHQFAMTVPSAPSGFIGEMVDCELVERVSPVIFY